MAALLPYRNGTFNAEIVRDSFFIIFTAILISLVVNNTISCDYKRIALLVSIVMTFFVFGELSIPRQMFVSFQWKDRTKTILLMSELRKPRKILMFYLDKPWHFYITTPSKTHVCFLCLTLYPLVTLHIWCLRKSNRFGLSENELPKKKKTPFLFLSYVVIQLHQKTTVYRCSHNLLSKVSN